MNRPTGFQFRQVIVDHIVLSRSVAICKEVSTNHEVEVPLLPLRVRIPAPREHWVIDRTFGNWSFAALLKTDDLFQIGKTPPHLGPTAPPGDPTSWVIGQTWVETPVKYWNGTTWSTTPP